MKRLWPPLILFLIILDFSLVFLIRIQIRKNQKASEIEVLLTPAPVPEITFVFVGDINLGREVNFQINQRKDFTFPFQKTETIIKGADLAIANLEGPLIENCPLMRAGMKFCGQKENIQGLIFAGFDLVNLANNHINNYGPQGVEETIRFLEESRIDYFDSEKIVFKEVKNLKIAFLGFDDTIKPIEEPRLIEKIKTAQEETDLVVVNFHWGQEYQSQPSERQKYLSRVAIDNGAEIIIGHHPHILQPLEYYQEKPIFYSLGNFVFDQMWSQETRIGIIVLITIKEKQIIKTGLIPVRIENYCQPEPISEPEKSEIINQVLRGLI